MPLIRPHREPVVLQLSRDLVRSLKRGHAWIFREALRDCPRAPTGSPAILLDHRKGQPVAAGWYDSSSPVAFRACRVDAPWELDDFWAEQRLQSALSLRRRLFPAVSVDVSDTTGYRLCNGEGDGLPGLVVDVYAQTAVMKLDGPAAEGFWSAEGLADWLLENLPLKTVVERSRERGSAGRVLTGEPIREPVEFREHGLRFTADVLHGQKTGFFLDQRENRRQVRGLAAGLKVLNLFSYTGGFSIAAGTGGATQVTSVDIAAPAIAESERHWLLNNLPAGKHEGVAVDVFEFLGRCGRRRWDLVIVDPPSFAPSEAAVSAAVASYTKLAAQAAQVTARQGLLALASCSSHITAEMFVDACQEGLSIARRRGTLLGLNGQPPDHPAPLMMPEFRYLKFLLLRLD